MRYVMGIDQGGSKTYAIIVSETGEVLGFGRSDGTCLSDGKPGKNLDYVEEAAYNALDQSGLALEQMDYIVAGLTGIDWEDEAGVLKAALQQRFHKEEICVVNDCIIAMRAGSSSEVSAVICVGSGTNCAVRNRDEMFIYGFYVPDEYQGGWSLGKKAVQAVFDAEMGLTGPTALRDILLDYFHVDSVDALLYRRATSGIADREYLGIPILLEQAALDNDAAALAIWEDFGRHLAGFVTARMRLMGILDEKIEIVLSGSIMKCKLPRFIQVVTEEITRFAPNAQVRSSVYEPIVGAALLGLDRLYGSKLPETVYENIEKSANRYDIKR